MAKLSGHLFRDTTNFRWRSWHVCGGQVTMFRESLVGVVPADPFEFQQASVDVVTHVGHWPLCVRRSHLLSNLPGYFQTSNPCEECRLQPPREQERST